jgi:hypothetical protein
VPRKSAWPKKKSARLGEASLAPSTRSGQCARDQISAADKFRDPDWDRHACAARESLLGPRGVWVSIDTLCNITRHNCDIESRPHNDRCLELTAGGGGSFDESACLNLGGREIGFMGEPRMDPQFRCMLEGALARRVEASGASNAMQPMQDPKRQASLLSLCERLGAAQSPRQLDHATQA